MPEWLLKKDNYIPQNGNDAFIDKSIISILNVLTRLKLQTENRVNKFGISAHVKVFSTLLIIILISISRSLSFVIFVDVFLLLIVSLLNADEIKYIIRISLSASVFTFIVLVPSILMGNRSNSFFIILKVLATVTAVNITSCITQWNDVLLSLKMFFVPDIFIFVLDITLKYLMIFGEFSLNMLYSLKLRSVGRIQNKNTSLFGIIGTLFLKSKEMSEEMYGAMECRGFSGEYKVYKKFRICINDFLFITANIVLIFVYLYFDRLG